MDLMFDAEAQGLDKNLKFTGSYDSVSFGIIDETKLKEIFNVLKVYDSTKHQDDDFCPPNLQMLVKGNPILSIFGVNGEVKVLDIETWKEKTMNYAQLKKEIESNLNREVVVENEGYRYPKAVKVAAIVLLLIPVVGYLIADNWDAVSETILENVTTFGLIASDNLFIIVIIIGLTVVIGVIFLLARSITDFVVAVQSGDNKSIFRTIIVLILWFIGVSLLLNAAHTLLYQ